MALSRSAEVVQKSLFEKGLSFEVVELGGITGGKIVSIKR
jgi:hypothetical protein